MTTRRSPLTLLATGLVVGVLVGVTAAVTGPAAADRVDDAVNGKPMVVKRAKNADKVDGKHAVSAGATPAQRKGRLVATDGAGRLPNNIIAKAGDADRLDGIDSSAFRVHSFDMGAGVPVGTSTVSYRLGAFGAGGLYVPDSGPNGFGWGLVLPPTFPTGATIRIRVLWHINQTGCTVHFGTNSASHDRVGLAPASGFSDAGLTGPGPVNVPSVANTTVESVFTAVPPRPGTTFKAGDSYAFSFFRPTGDTCTTSAIVSGVSLTY